MRLESISARSSSRSSSDAGENHTCSSPDSMMSGPYTDRAPPATCSQDPSTSYATAGAAPQPSTSSWACATQPMRSPSWDCTPGSPYASPRHPYFSLPTQGHRYPLRSPWVPSSSSQPGYHFGQQTGPDGVGNGAGPSTPSSGMDSSIHMAWQKPWNPESPSRQGISGLNGLPAGTGVVESSASSELIYGASGWQNASAHSRVARTSQELSGFEKARFSLENGRDFDFLGKDEASCSRPSDSLQASQNSPRETGLGSNSEKAELDQLPASLSTAELEAHTLNTISSCTSGQNEGRPPGERSNSGSRGQQMGRVRSRHQRHRRSDSNLGSNRPSTSVDSGQHTGPVFHPLPSLFSYPMQSLQPWLPTAGIKKDLPTVAVLNSCRKESKMVSEYSDSHQAMSLMLALPGLPISTAPMLTLQEAGNILRVVNKPLAVLKVGRLTKSVSPNPNMLKATDDVGILALWLLPTSEVKVIWHSLKHPAPSGQKPVEWEMEDAGNIFPSGDGAPFKEVFCFIEASEELACIPPRGDKPLDKENSVQLNTIDQDPSGRSFRLTRRSSHVRQRRDLAAKLDAEKLKTGGRVSRETAKLQALLRACTSEPDEEENLFFWVAEPSLAKGRQILEEMQTQVDDMPSLSMKAGVPQEKLQKVHDCFMEAARIAEATNTEEDNKPFSPMSFSSWFGFGPGLAAPSHLFAMGSPTNIFDQMAKSTTRSRGTSRGSASSCGSRSASPSSSDYRSDEVSVSDSCVLSATANFLVSDRRWNLNHLSTVTMTVAVGVVSTGEVVDKETSEKAAKDCAHELAKRKAERGAQAEAERLGRRRLEELAAQKAAKLPKRDSFASLTSEPGDLHSSAPYSQHGARFRSGEEDSHPITPTKPRSTTAISPGGIHPGDETNYWQHNLNQQQGHLGFTWDKMSVPFHQQNSDAEGRVGNGLLDSESTLGLGFGSGAHPMRNSRTPHFAEARPPGGYHDLWQTKYNQMRQFMPEPGQIPPPHVPVLPSVFPWSMPLSPWGHAYRGPGLQIVPNTPYMIPNPQGCRFYPRHLPPGLPFLDFMNRSAVAGGHTSYRDNFSQLHPMSAQSTNANSLNEGKENISVDNVPDIRKRLGEVRRSLDEIRSRSCSEKNDSALNDLYHKSMDQVRRRSMDEVRKRKIEEVRRRSLGDICRKSLDGCRRSIDWDVGQYGEPEFRRGCA